MKKRMLSILLTLCMMLMLCPVTAFAETAPPDIVFDGNSGTVNGSNVSLSADFTLQGEQTLTIENGKTLTIPSGKTLTVEENGVIVVAEGGSLVVGDGGSLTNHGTIYVEGTFTGTADNLYYPLSYTFYPPLDRYLNTAGIDGSKTYNGKTYGKAGSSLSFYGFPAIGSNQLFKLVTTTSDGSNSVATNGSTPSVMMPYTVKEGSTVVTLKADYVATLSAGEYSIGIVSESGTATTTFTVNAKTVVDNDTNSPQTGDNSHMALWIALILVSGAGVIGTTVYGKKKRSVKNI